MLRVTAMRLVGLVALSAACTGMTPGSTRHVDASTHSGDSAADPYGTTYQPNEHVLQLTAAHVAELDAALQALGATAPPQQVVHDDFVIDPT